MDDSANVRTPGHCIDASPDGDMTGWASASRVENDPNGEGTDGSRVLIVNPISGSGEHTEQVYALADEYGFVVRETKEDGDAVVFAREEAPGAALLGACGGDGTLNGVVRGAYEADALDSTTICVIPAGTSNNFAGNIGVTGVESAFELTDGGETREIDLGIAAGRPFVNSCIAGITANASSETTSTMKDNWGALAYVLGGLQTAAEFEGLKLAIEIDDESEHSWDGKAAFVLIGNGRCFPVDGRTQANMEDGLFEVTIIKDRPTSKLVGEAALQRLLGADMSNITRLQASSLTISVQDDEPRTFSLDGEMLSTRDLDVNCENESLSLLVGEGYEPTPTTDVE
jgi:YegS/Rv2252/BmrU family lipid kinase